MLGCELIFFFLLFFFSLWQSFLLPLALLNKFLGLGWRVSATLLCFFFLRINEFENEDKNDDE